MINFQQNIPLKNYSNYKIGGLARLFTEVESTEELKKILRLAKSSALKKITILGGGTNVLISDEGFDGLVILNRMEGIVEGEGGNLTVGSGTLVRDLLAYCAENSLTGLEWAGGLPGTIGGAVRGNAGAFKGEIKDIVVEVESLDLKTVSSVAGALNEKIRNNAQCQFTYRNSIFKSGDGVNEFITHVILVLTLGDKKEIEKKIQQKVDYRNNRHPMNYPNIGSVFKNIPLNLFSNDLQKEFSSIVKIDPFPVVPTTKLLALCGLRGKRVGGVGISGKQPNFFVNLGNGSSADVEALIAIAKQAVKDKYGILLEEEIVRLN